MNKISVVFTLAIMLMSSSIPMSAQVRYNSTINYSPPEGQSGCIYTINVEITMPINRSKNGMDINYSIKIASLDGLLIDGKKINSGQLPAAVVQEYENPPSFFKIPVELTISGGGYSQTLNSLGGSSIAWYSLLGGAFSHDQTVMDDYKERGTKLYNNGDIKITSVKVYGTLGFDPTPWRNGK